MVARRPVLKRVHVAQGTPPRARAVLASRREDERPTRELATAEVLRDDPDEHTIRHASEIRALRGAPRPPLETESLDEITELHVDAIVELDGDDDPTFARPFAVPFFPTVSAEIVSPPASETRAPATTLPEELPPVAKLPSIAELPKLPLVFELPPARSAVPARAEEPAAAVPAPAEEEEEEQEEAAATGSSSALVPDARMESAGGTLRLVGQVLYAPIALVSYLYNAPSLLARAVLVLLWMAFCSAMTLLVTQ